MMTHDGARTTGPAGLRKDQTCGESCGNQTCVKVPRGYPQTSLTLSSSLVGKAFFFTLKMSTEKLTMDSDGYFSRRRGPGPGPIDFTSLVQLLTASMSVIIIVLAIQQGTHYQKIVADLEKEVAVMKARQEVDLTLLSARLEALEAKTNNAQVTGDMNPRPQAELDKTSDASKSVAESYASTESADVPWPAHHQRQKRAANSVTWPAGAGACLQGPPGRDGRDGMPGRDCPCGTKATEIDELQRKCEDLEQRVSDLENKTETTPTPMPCSGDTCNLPSSCTEVAGRSGFDNQAFYVIDPDGPGRGVLPMVVQCDLEGQTAITLIGHDSEARTHVNGVEDPGSYSKDVTYWNSMDQVRAVVDQSSLCKQLIKYECHGSLIWNSAGIPYAWWVTWDGRQADYWGGASPGSGKCACGQTGTCSGRCNCNANDYTWREDSGFLSHKDDLPVTQLRFGDTTNNNGNEEGYYTLGKLICYP